MDAPADAELMQLVAGGDARAFEVVFDRHADGAFSLAYRMCGRPAFAEEIVEAAFLSLWRTGARYDPGIGDVRAWILRAVHQAGIAALRARALGDPTGHGPSSGDALADQLRPDAEPLSREAVERLPPAQRRVIELAYFGGLTQRHIAELLKLPELTVKDLMSQGLTALSVLPDPK